MDCKQTYHNIKEAKYSFPQGVLISPLAKHLIQSLLVRDPDKRMSVSQIMKHPFFLTKLPPGAQSLNAQLAFGDKQARRQSTKDLKQRLGKPTSRRGNSLLPKLSVGQAS